MCKVFRIHLMVIMCWWVPGVNKLIATEGFVARARTVANGDGTRAACKPSDPLATALTLSRRVAEINP